jgi:drug/metabolite transporter (DMT)-like permease
MIGWIHTTSPENRGAFLLVLGISIFGFSDNLTLAVSDQVGVGQFHFSRSIIAIIIIAAFSRIFGYSLMPVLWQPMLARTAFMVFAILLYFSVMPMMPIAEAGAGLFTSPIFVLLFSSLFFKEKIGWRRALAVLIGTAGVVLILQPGQEGFSMYHLLPILSGASYALGSIVTYRYLSQESPMAILISFFIAIGFCGAFVASTFSLLPIPNSLTLEAPFLFSGWRTVGSSFWTWMLIIAVGASIALSLMTRAYQIAKTSYAAIYEYAYLLSVGVFGWVFWGVTPDFMGLVGIMLIVFAGVIIMLAQQNSDNKPLEDGD